MGFLFFLNTGYTFCEIYRPLIKGLGFQYPVHVLQSKFYFSESVQKEIEQFQAEGLIRKAYVVDVAKMNKESSYEYQRRISQFINTIEKIPSGVLVLDNDTEVFNKYLILWARKMQMKTIVLQTSTIWRLLMEYRRRLGLPIFAERREENLSWRLLLRPFKRMYQALVVWYRAVVDYVFCPLLLQGRPLPHNQLDNLSFSIGMSDQIICYDQMEKEALEMVISKKLRVDVCQHPSSGVCRCITGESKPNRLLVVFGGNLNEELSGWKFDRWQKVIEDIISLGRITTVDIRIHPRTREHIQWPQRLLEALKISGVQVNLIRTQDISLPDSVCNYKIILGGPSGSLRVARAVCPHLIVLGMADCSDSSPDDQEWILADAAGIRWIHQGKVHKEYLDQTNITTDQNRKTVKEVIEALI